MTHPAGAPYAVTLSGVAAKQLARLPDSDIQRIQDALEQLARTGQGDTRRLKGSGGYRPRVGAYRVFFDVSRRMILVSSIHRRTGTTY